MFEHEHKEYYKNIDVDKMSASIKDVFRFIKNFDEYIAEFKGAKCYFEIYFINNQIIIKLCEEYYINEYRDGSETIETGGYSHIVAKISASAIEYADMLVDFIENKELYDEIYGKRRVNSIHFIKTKYAKIATSMMV